MIACLLGRRSYGGYERLRVDHADSPMLAYLDGTPTYVVSSTLEVAPRDRVTMPTRRLPLRLTGSTAVRSGVLELQYVPAVGQD